MTVSIIEGRTQGTEVWSPIAVGNASARTGVRYISDLPKANAKSQTPKFAVMHFNKDGGASESEGPRRQRIYESYSPQLHKMCRALGVSFNKNGWSSSSTEIDRKSLRLLSFANHVELNKYLLEREIKPVVSGTEVTEVTVAQSGQTVAELYQELGKVMASNPKAATAKVVAANQNSEFRLTDEQALLLQRNIQAALIKNAGQSIAKRLESQANGDIAKLYQEFGIKNPPTIKLVTEVVTPAKPEKVVKK
ncbi:hypothetical protein D3C75_531740 [compost metagenome]